MYPGNQMLAILAALSATMAWSLTFIVPNVVGNASIFNFYAVEFLMLGLLSAGYLVLCRGARRTLRPHDCWVAAGLGVLGFPAYCLAVTGATICAGPVMAPAFVSLVPVALAISGNLCERTVAWRRLGVPLSLATGGLVLVNWGDWSGPDAGDVPVAGIALALMAIALWVGFGLWNQRALACRPSMDTQVWTALMLCGAGGGMLAFTPIGLSVGVLGIPGPGVPVPSATRLLAWAAVLGILVNVWGGWAWNYSSKSLPVVLAAQLITMEPTFGTLLGLWVRRRWPTWSEGVGMALLLMGVVTAIQRFQRPRCAPCRPAQAPQPGDRDVRKLRLL